MVRIIPVAALAAFAGLSGCGNSDFQRGVTGAAGGAAVGELAGGSPLVGAAVGGVAGVYCDDLGICP
jgi:osmotically inducible lipoprotein OsmB